MLLMITMIDLNTYILISIKLVFHYGFLGKEFKTELGGIRSGCVIRYCLCTKTIDVLNS